jgi:hypothetical protein
MDEVIFIAEYIGHKLALSKPKEGYYLARRVLLTEACFIQKVDEIDIRSGNIPVSPDKVLLSGGFYAVPTIMCVAVVPHTRVLGTCGKIDFGYISEHSPLWMMTECDYTEASTAMKECEIQRRDELARVVTMQENLFTCFCVEDFDAKRLSADTVVTVEMSMSIQGNQTHERVTLKETGQDGLQSALFLSEHWRYISSELGADDYSFEILVGEQRALKYEGKPKQEGSTDGAVPGLSTR